MRKFGFLRLILPLIVLFALWCACVSAFGEAVWPEASGDDVKTNGKLVIDVSHKEQGYVMACISSSSSKRLKLRVTYGDVKLNYDLNGDGSYEIFPLQMGSGKYVFSLFMNTKGKKYSSEGKIEVSVKLENENAAYLVPNQYVNYGYMTAAVQKSYELCNGKSEKDAYKAVKKFMKSEFAYDFVRALMVEAGQLPDIDYCFENKMGICQDLAAVTVCMLRVQGIPAKLVIGYADKNYHAWTTIVVNGEEVFFDPTAVLGAISNIKSYNAERMY